MESAGSHGSDSEPMKSNLEHGYGIARGWRGAVDLGVFVAGLALAGVLQGQIIIDVSEVYMAPNRANQAFDVFIQNEGGPLEVTGIGFNIQMADGGPEAGGLIDGPAIMLVDVITDTIFESNNNGGSGSGSIVPQVYERGTMTVPPEPDGDESVVVIGTGRWKIARVTLDTTGFDSGTYALTLNTLNSPTKFTMPDADDMIPILIEGSVTVVPEPGGWALGTGMMLLGYAGVRAARGHRRSGNQTG